MENTPAEETFQAQNAAVHAQDDEISLIDLFAVLLKRKAMIITVTVLAMIGAVVFSIISLVLPPDKSPMPNEYTPHALMLINNSDSSGSSLSSMINSSGLSSLAGLAGVSTNSSSYSSLAVYLAGTNTFLDSVVDKFDLVARYKIKKSPRAESRKALKKLLTADYDEDSGVFSISFTDKDPVFAQSVVNYAADFMEDLFTQLGVDKNLLEKKNLEENIDNSYNEIKRLEQEIRKRENTVSYGYNPAAASSIVLDTSMLKLELDAQKQVYTQLKTQLEVLKVSMASDTPVFQILERGEVADQKAKPSRGKLCIIVTFAAFFLSIFMAFALNAVENIKKDPEAMAKLSRKGK
ncbi:MAG: lipopolysaccharide biosynthesis protein [Treponema sp.]|nr:lipopolysaccharide biosynthesis protein [Treponema sp.]